MILIDWKSPKPTTNYSETNIVFVATESLQITKFFMYDVLDGQWFLPFACFCISYVLILDRCVFGPRGVAVAYNSPFNRLGTLGSLKRRSVPPICHSWTNISSFLKFLTILSKCWFYQNDEMIKLIIISKWWFDQNDNFIKMIIWSKWWFDQNDNLIKTIILSKW